MVWNGVSYIGASARMPRSCRPANGGLPFQASNAGPMLRQANGTWPAFSSSTFSFEPLVSRTSMSSGDVRASTAAAALPNSTNAPPCPEVATTMRLLDCARAASGHPAAALLAKLRKSRRRMHIPKDEHTTE